jgi:release factor glutamine methyltransferase
MKKVLKYIITQTYKPLLVKYLSGTRSYTYKNIRVEVPPTVFHPGFFFSTKLLLNYISEFDLKERSLLELGAGSGLISLFAASKGAIVTASDISESAVNALRKNKYTNNEDLHIIHSDMFDSIPKQYFDFIAVNPPYYKQDPATEKDHAWFCGTNGEYFHKFFSQLSSYINEHSKVLMVLCDGCDLDMIKAFAAKNQLLMECVRTDKNYLETNFIYSIRM